MEEIKLIPLKKVKSYPGVLAADSLCLCGMAIRFPGSQRCGMLIAAAP